MLFENLQSKSMKSFLSFTHTSPKAKAFGEVVILRLFSGDIAVFVQQTLVRVAFRQGDRFFHKLFK